MNAVQKVVEHTAYTERDVFFHSFRGEHQAIVENHLRLYRLRGTIPNDVEAWCKKAIEEWSHPIELKRAI